MHDLRHQKYMELMEFKQQLAVQYLKQHGFEVIVHNGQRHSTNLHLLERDMEKVTQNEVFIGKLPRDMFEHELLPYLSTVGPIYKIRMMLEFSGCNRGYCFIKYASHALALKAVQLLDGMVIRDGKPPIGVMVSFDNKCLFFGNLPQDCTEQALINALRKADVGGIVRAQMLENPIMPMPRKNCTNFTPSINWSNTNKTINRVPLGYQNIYGSNLDSRFFSNAINFDDQNKNIRYDSSVQPALNSADKFCYVYFESHDAATKARRILLPGNVLLFKRRITLDWAKSEPISHNSRGFSNYKISSPSSMKNIASSSNVWSLWS